MSDLYIVKNLKDNVLVIPGNKIIFNKFLKKNYTDFHYTESNWSRLWNIKSFESAAVLFVYMPWMYRLREFPEDVRML